MIINRSPKLLLAAVKHNPPPPPPPKKKKKKKNVLKVFTHLLTSTYSLNPLPDNKF